jgi:hypothetical protein
MRESEWPYNLPIWRSAHRASSPDGRFIAEIDPAYEISMGNPTFGTLRLSVGLELERCNPSFIWSEDSRYLAVPRYIYRLGLFRRQRMIIIDTLDRLVVASPETAHYFQPESFIRGRLVATKNPFRGAEPIVWRIPADLGSFTPLHAAWRAEDASRGCQPRS